MANERMDRRGFLKLAGAGAGLAVTAVVAEACGSTPASTPAPIDYDKLAKAIASLNPTGTPRPDASASMAAATAVATATPGASETPAPTDAAVATATAPALRSEFPLAGTTFHSNRDAGGEDPYALFVTPDGRYYQPGLPKGKDRKWFAVAILLPRGHKYEINQVAGKAYLDLDNNGQGSKNPVVEDHENGKIIDVPASTGKEIDPKNAWMLIEDDGGFSAGVEVKLVPPATN